MNNLFLPPSNCMMANVKVLYFLIFFLMKWIQKLQKITKWHKNWNLFFFEITLELNNTINWEFFPFVMSETNLYSAESLNCSLVCCWRKKKKANHLTLPQDCKSLIFYSTRCLLISQFHLTKSERAECQQLL